MDLHLEVKELDIFALSSIIELENRLQLSPWNESQIRAEFSNSASIRYAGYFSGQLCAYVFAHFVEDEVSILNIAVKTDFQRKGFGKKILQNLLENCQNRGAKKAFLEVRKSNLAAQNLYQALGFVEIAIRAHYYKDEAENAIIMQKEL